MEIGMVGLGRMGGNMVRRLLAGGHAVVAYDPDQAAVSAAAAEGAGTASSLAGLVAALEPPRAVWIMVPSGAATEATITELSDLLAPEDTIIDGGNSYYRDSMRRGAALAEKGINFLDAGTSGGVWGLKEGYSLMVGGDPDVYRRLEPVFRTLAPGPDRGCGRVGGVGAGHFVKMVHNGIEYGLMQAYAEGFELLAAKKDFSLDLHQVAKIWRSGSVIRSWLLDLAAAALEQEPDLGSVQPYVADSGEGRWTVQESLDLGVPVPVITQALQARFRSQQEQPFGLKLLAALRQQFGGHELKRR